MIRQMMKRLSFLLLACLLPAAAHAGVTVEGAWVRLAPPVADTTAAYMVIRNSGDRDVEITGVTTRAAARPEFHRMAMQDGMMRMQRMEQLIVPAHGERTFAPGGDHLMLNGLNAALHAGEQVEIRLQTDAGELVVIEAEVRDMRGMQGMHHHGM